MGTHSRIGKLLPTGKVRSVYCHYDGYVQGGVGEDLFNHYQDESKIDALLDLGNLSGVGKEIGEKQDFYDFPNQNPNWCLAYGRDRNEKNQEATIVESEEAYLKEENASYIYLYKNGEWWFKDIYQDRYSGMQTIDSALNIKEEDEDE
jgi:hypothetical protein